MHSEKKCRHTWSLHFLDLRSKQVSGHTDSLTQTATKKTLVRYFRIHSCRISERRELIKRNLLKGPKACDFPSGFSTWWLLKLSWYGFAINHYDSRLAGSTLPKCVSPTVPLQMPTKPSHIYSKLWLWCINLSIYGQSLSWAWQLCKNHLVINWKYHMGQAKKIWPKLYCKTISVMMMLQHHHKTTIGHATAIMDQISTSCSHVLLSHNVLA